MENGYMIHLDRYTRITHAPSCRKNITAREMGGLTKTMKIGGGSLPRVTSPDLMQKSF
ncbi:hypothetical protein RHMOL_Rhmol03G0197700 [Rhododendron molle]|uniref:Uncharacterized protein n=1 Tax=Rhododendron molle TaxID=49168 RepID=A0ACC0PJH4_RHOML|nr:hypothetical protein RHMOL_Rhmol03G0197700 [Rhododendron molle]